MATVRQFISRAVSVVLASVSLGQTPVPAQTPTKQTEADKAKKDADKAKKDADAKAEEAKQKAAIKKAIEMTPQARAARKAQALVASQVNLNTATEAELLKLHGVNKKTAQQIIQSRPFTSSNELVTKKILTEPAYKKIAGRVTVK